jgi:hypothetical protein
VTDVLDRILYAVYELVYAKPPLGAAYGYRWQPGQGVPNALTTYDVRSSTVPPGLYVAFAGTALDPAKDFFGRAAGHGPVFVASAAVSAALSNLVTSVARNAPTGEASWWRYPNQVRLRDVDGYLSYVALCLNFINQTAAGQQLVTDLVTNPVRTTFITPGMFNMTRGGGDNGVTTLTEGLAHYAQRDGAIPSATIDAAVQATYGNNGLAGYNQLAAAMNAAPLYTCFDTEANFQPAYLQNTFLYNGSPLAGNDLHAWVNATDNGAFDAALQSMARRPDWVLPLQFFLLALDMTLLPAALPGPGNGAAVNFSTQNAGINDLNNPRFRPPAIGLAHELMHAWHYTRGRSPGYDSGQYDTTAAELKFSGIGPYAGDPVTENAVRAQWAGVGGLDQSNTWRAPAQRLVYEPLQPDQTAAEARKAYHCI